MAASLDPDGKNGGPVLQTIVTNRAAFYGRLTYTTMHPGDPIARWANLNGVYTGDPARPCRADNSNPYPTGDVRLTLFDAWTADVMRIDCVDTTRHIIYLTGATQGNAGRFDFFGPSAGHRYIVENAKDTFHQEQQDGQTGICVGGSAACRRAIECTTPTECPGERAGRVRGAVTEYER
jgi:hypothetical protein